jgi:hypothetical protein
MLRLAYLFIYYLLKIKGLKERRGPTTACAVPVLLLCLLHSCNNNLKLTHFALGPVKIKKIKEKLKC